MTEDRNDWQALGELWRQPPPDPLPDLLATLERRTRRIWILTAMDVVATLAAIVAMVVMAGNGLGPGEGVLFWFLSIALIVGWAVTLWLRHGTWRHAGDQPLDVLNFAIRRCTASIRLARFNQGALVLGIGLGLVVGALDVTLPDFDLGSSGARLALKIGAVIFFVGWFAAAGFYARKRTAERDRLESLRTELVAEQD